MCVFCEIVAGNIPSAKVYEDDKVLAFLDISPVTPGHTLVVPKSHHASLEEADEGCLDALVAAVAKVGALVKSRLGAPGYNVIVNNDPVAGQEVPHLHFHIIPRYGNDQLAMWPKQPYGEGEKEEILRRLTS